MYAETRTEPKRIVGAALILLMFLSVAGLTVDLLWDPALTVRLPGVG